jgi:hypothetical protein
MVAAYELTKDDPTLLELKDEIALIHTRALDLMKRVDSGESGHLWNLLFAAYNDLEEARASGDGGKMAEALNAMGALIRRGAADYRAWEEVTKQIDRKQRLVESERKRAIELQQTVTMDQMLMFLATQRHAIIDVIKDQALLSALFTRLADGFRASGLRLPGRGDPTVH